MPMEANAAVLPVIMSRVWLCMAPSVIEQVRSRSQASRGMPRASGCL